MQQDSPSSEPSREADLVGFSTSRRRAPDPMDPEHTTVTAGPESMTPPGDPLAGFDPTTDPASQYRELRDEFEDALDATSSASSSSSRASTPRGVDPSIAHAAAGVFAMGAQLAGFLLDRSVGKSSTAWLMREEEAAAIAEPLGRIAARHAPIDSGDAGDIADALEAGVGVAMYATRASLEQYGLEHSGAAQAAPPAGEGGAPYDPAAYGGPFPGATP